MTIPVNGKVVAEFKDVSLDTVLGMVSVPPFQRLGLDTRLNGTALATWVKGDANTVTVDANLGMSAPAQGAAAHPAKAQEVPASGAIDATYRQHDGAVEVRKLELQLPASTLLAHGQLGAYPLTSPTALSVDFHTRNFGEFDAVLRSLGLKRRGRSGAAALPVALSGQADFDGTWAGSLVRPRLAGHLQGTELGVEMPTQSGANGPPRFVHLDSLEASGSYASARIAVLHAVAVRGKTRIVFHGTLDAPEGSQDNSAPEFNAESVLHLRAEASNVNVDDVQPFLVQSLPLTGTINAQIQADEW